MLCLIVGVSTPWNLEMKEPYDQHNTIFIRVGDKGVGDFNQISIRQVTK